MRATQTHKCVCVCASIQNKTNLICIRTDKRAQEADNSANTLAQSASNPYTHILPHTNRHTCIHPSLHLFKNICASACNEIRNGKEDDGDAASVFNFEGSERGQARMCVLVCVYPLFTRANRRFVMK